MMAEPKGKKSPNQKRHRKAVAPQMLTAEEQAAIKAAQEKAELERKAEVERLENWEKSVEKMNHNQLTSEVKRLIRKEHVKIGKGLYEPQAGLTIAYSTIFDAILGSTKTLYDKKDKPYPNPSPFAALSCYVR